MNPSKNNRQSVPHFLPGTNLPKPEGKSQISHGRVRKAILWVFIILPVLLFNHCAQEREDTPPEAKEIQVEINLTNPSQTGASDGKITITVSGGYPPYTYLWSNGVKTANLENIQAGKYSLKITDSKGNTHTEEVELTDKVKDIDGNSYGVVKIGNQYWMRENLKVTRAPDGTAITSYAYNNDTSMVRNYGRLYTWNVAMNGTKTVKAQGICPSGWHIPDDEEFKTLEMALGMTRQEADLSNGWRGNTVGTQMKKGGTSGYDAPLGGRRGSNGAFSLLNRAEYVWTSSESGTLYAWRRCLDLYSDQVGRYDTFDKNYGFSLRCVRD